MKRTIALLFLIANPARAARLEDITVLDSVLAQDGLELKLQIKDGRRESYFFVNVTRSDRNAFDKLAMVIRKLKKGHDFKLVLDIPSFSAFPSGSYYRSEYVNFSGSALQE